ncbi:hypothetical protein FHG64_12160 [Antarcticibacterium flavum]|uniref:NnrS family protein n=1 Tax=Antarcticibacterium flavum TaxID=2058175 RepID=A0A5B7X640_9FLAO|nr:MULTISPECIES: hypothetical protein [Antarcticibacterium]MCM4158329.1 hypothetical protein [Antarcticibacterium sp. W02-3]QCY70093.1 hypothetical protein FHG64_12160 [Antarcticibacterium flavum]
MINLKKHSNIALGYFLLVGLLGLFLRLFFVTPVAANFRYVVHAHSHIALLGWVYIGLITLFYRMYFKDSQITGTYRKIFWFTNITLVGMLLTFPFQGYALFSIIFSTLFLIASYWLAWFFIKKVPKKYRERSSWKCVKASLIYMIISSIGPWAIGGVMATLGNTSIWYKLSIYFYLHFQYNAWFILALLGVLFFLVEHLNIRIDKKAFNSFFILLNAALILSLFLSALWVEPPAVFFILAAAGAIFQAWAFIQFFRIIRPVWKELAAHISLFTATLLKITALFLAVKILMQLLTAFPYFAGLSYLYPDFVIGYLHLVFLGIISIALFAFLNFFNLLKISRKIFWIYLAGFLLSEALIFYKGAAIWLGLPFFTEYFLILLIISALMPLAIAILLAKNLKSSIVNDSGR